MSAQLTREDVTKVALLARLELTEDELDTYTGQLAAVIDHAADVAALDLADIPPLHDHRAIVSGVMMQQVTIPSRCCRS